MAASIAAAGIPGPGTPVSQADSFTNACEVAMEAPLVGALMFERTEKGALVCYDLGRK